MGVPLRAAGKRVRCPKCNKAFRVPSHAEPVTVPPAQQNALSDDLLGELAGGVAVESAEELRDRLAAAAAKPKPKVVKAVASKREKSQSGPRGAWGPWFVDFGAVLFRQDWPSRICILMLLFGGVFVYLGIQETRLRGRSSAEPQHITCEQLSTSGPGDNLHVAMSDFVLLPMYVYDFGLTGWSGAWVPAVSLQQLNRHVAQFLKVDLEQLDDVADEKWDEALDAIDVSSFSFNVIVSLPDVRGEKDVDEFGEQATIQGTIMDDFTSLDSDTRKLLREEYSGVDFDRCSILIAGRRPHSAGIALLYIVGGALGVLVAGGVAARRASLESA
jgi:hypothetical protein